MICDIPGEAQVLNKAMESHLIQFVSTGEPNQGQEA